MFLGVFFIINASLFLFHQLLYCTAELVGARCWSAVAADALETCNYILVLHAFYKAADALQVTVAATVELHVDNDAVIACQFNET